MRLVKSGGIKNSVVCRPQALNTHVSTVYEIEAGPRIVSGGMVCTIWLNGCECVKPIPMASSSVGKVQNARRILEAIGVNVVVVNGNSPLVQMSMTVDINVNAVLVKDSFKGSLAVCTDGSG